MTTSNIRQFLKNLVSLTVFALVIGLSASAQNTDNTSKTRIAVVASENKTNIWVSDFPKSTTVVLFDENDTLLTIVSTNEFGAAYISLPKSITTTIIAKTMNGDVSASNKAVQPKQEQTLAATAVESNNASKA